MKFRKFFGFVVIAAMLLCSMPLKAVEIVPAIAGNWEIIKVDFGRVSAITPAQAKAFIGKELEQYKGWLSSPFGKCDFCGLSMTYEKRTAKELSGDYPGIAMKLPNGYALVHELTWGHQESLTLIQVDSNTMYLPYEGAMFMLKIKQR